MPAEARSVEDIFELSVEDPDPALLNGEGVELLKELGVNVGEYGSDAIIEHPCHTGENAPWPPNRLSDLRCLLPGIRFSHEISAPEEQLWADIVFHSRQAAEKAMKAFLAWHDAPFRKTHNIEELGQARVRAGPNPASDCRPGGAADRGCMEVPLSRRSPGPDRTGSGGCLGDRSRGL